MPMPWSRTLSEMRVDVGSANIDDDVFVSAGIFHGVVEQIEDGGAKLFGISHDDQIVSRVSDPKRRHSGREVMTEAGELEGIGDDGAEVDLPASCACE